MATPPSNQGRNLRLPFLVSIAIVRAVFHFRADRGNQMRSNSRRTAFVLALALTALVFVPIGRAVDTPTTHFFLSFSPSQSETALHGRLLLLLSTDPSAEPRMQIDDSVRTQLV